MSQEWSLPTTFMYMYVYFLDFFVIFFAESLPDPATVSQLPKSSFSISWQVLSTNTTQF